MTHPFEIELSTPLPADPEQVWAAIATGPGIDAWFMGRNEVEPREGGTASMDTGGHVAQAVITAFEPGKRFATRTATAEDGRFMAFEYLIEGRAGGSTVLRLVHSGLLGDDWQDEYDALRRGWPFHLHTLAEYLTHFPGRTAVPVFALAMPAGQSAEQLGTVLARGLALPDRPPVGARVQARPEGLPVLDGEVTWSNEEHLQLRTADGIFSFHHGPGVVLTGHHLFGPAPAGAEAAWQQWLTDLFA
ncbi:SRPBCC domain-containing protein [Streptomyces tateyamensis]|uniref:SRPBCC domain-containing protein n=1 Tax=Streptomyces tateyamensis TaxID=565073 RepID=A0A2V4NUT2_9ACTN|nr:SRPBCC domain-containing protein [Streptomyces tateyamensis]PYC80261.1 SRPBCC domain-containing protein [Streptomyces tateyamensis]